MSLWSIFKRTPNVIKTSGTVTEETDADSASNSFCPAKIVDGVVVPNNWYVHEAGQSPIHMLWGVTLVNFDTLFDVEPTRVVSGDEFNTLGDAIKSAVEQINIIEESQT